MGRTIVVAILVTVGCIVIVLVLGRILDSETLSSVAIPAGAGAGLGYVISARMNRQNRS